MMPQTKLPLAVHARIVRFGRLGLSPGGDAGVRVRKCYSRMQYGRLYGSGQWGRQTLFRHKPKLSKHLQLGDFSAMGVYGIRFF